ncbi:hypothetical protein EAX61_02140 [Dokdonia sinensis]|uniref:Uncharacterized protein n=1 Tax=Dokdonia sinensis TaxID=2479847 RepID=A0A3M0H0V4_9FLAO|nr:hypothetical protein [Dokdonia sinensis]RMB63216.1 hypothetical protein EAX61_02140 [Dokdonia sinensis]
MDYYKAGYYLMKTRPVRFGTFKDKHVLTCSSCINVSLLDTFSRPWTIHKNEKEEAINSLGISYKIIESIHTWTNQMDRVNKIGYPNLFNCINSAQEYRDRFFQHLNDIKILGVYLPTVEKNDFIEHFEPQSKEMGEIGLRYNLRKQELDNDEGNLLGFDMIGIEIGGDFHSFHCHDLFKDLKSN